MRKTHYKVLRQITFQTLHYIANYLSRVTKNPTLSVCDQQSDQDPCRSLTNPITSRETDSEQHVSWSDCADAQAGLDPCWSQTHYVGFVVTRLISFNHFSYSRIFVWSRFCHNVRTTCTFRARSLFWSCLFIYFYFFLFIYLFIYLLFLCMSLKTNY
jgi:hypothetical protein